LAARIFWLDFLDFFFISILPVNGPLIGEAL